MNALSPTPPPGLLAPILDPAELARTELEILERAKKLARHMVRPGTLLAGRYRVARILRRDPHGLLVSAVHEGCGKNVEIRVITRAHATEARIERLQAEARLLAKLESSHLARILDVGRLESGGLYLVRDQVRGASLDELSGDASGLSLGEALTLFAQVADAVDEAHLHGVVLRDLQPRDIRVEHAFGVEPRAKICDLGACAVVCAPGAGIDLTQQMAISPTAAPEVLRGEAIDARADLWSLGCLLYQLLSGGPAFAGEGVALLYAITTESPTPLAALRPDLPRALQPIFDWTLAKDPRRRPVSVNALLRALVPLATATTRIDIQRILPRTAAIPATVPSNSPTLPRRLRPSPPRGRDDASARLIPVDFSLPGPSISFAGSSIPVDFSFPAATIPVELSQASIPVDHSLPERSIPVSFARQRAHAPPAPPRRPFIEDAESLDLSLELGAEDHPHFPEDDPVRDSAELWMHEIAARAGRRRFGLFAGLAMAALPLVLVATILAARGATEPDEPRARAGLRAQVTAAVHDVECVSMQARFHRRVEVSPAAATVVDFTPR